MMYGLAVLLALTGAPHSESVRFAPPAQYDHPFAGKVFEITANTMAEMAVLCAPHPRAGRLFGCGPHGSPEECHIIIAPVDYLNIYGVTAEQVRRHEMAHCNGWPAHHPRP
jgi:hypothetical protein